MVSGNLGSLHYILDHVYAAFVHRTKLSTPFFSRGWGGNKLYLLETMIQQLFPELGKIQKVPPTSIQPRWRTVWETKSSCLREGTFQTPCDEQLMSALPPESYTARVAFLVPKSVPPQKMACVVHLAGKLIEVDILLPSINIFTLSIRQYRLVPSSPIVICTGTGDHTFDRRLRLGGPLLKQNIATMVLER